MKFLPQDMFECFALAIAKWRTIDDDSYKGIKADLHNSYKDSYSGDVLWLDQAVEIVPDLIKLVSDMGATDKFRSLHVAMEFRQKLDDDLNPLSTTKKIFAGTIFTKSHPAPHLRKEIAIKNIKALYVKMAMLGFQHK